MWCLTKTNDSSFSCAFLNLLSKSVLCVQESLLEKHAQQPRNSQKEQPVIPLQFPQVDGQPEAITFPLGPMKTTPSY